VSEGTVIADKFRLIRMLGKGGMGSVWVAEHRGLDTHVAVKFMSVEHAHNDEALARFKREAAAAARIKSPNVVQIFDHGFTTNNVPYIVMELLEGEDLMRRIQRAGPLPLAFVCDVVGQVCKALSRAHKAGIVHRDIKPENIFLSEMDGERLIKVLDFGIAKGTPESNLSMTSTGAALGSPYYMSPEQIMSAKAVDPRSDLWSLGIVAYQALTGTLPFEGETVGALAVAINDGIYKPPSKLRDDIPAEVDRWFEKVFVKKPEGRFASAREMAKAFEEAMGSLLFADAQTSVAPLASFDDEDSSGGHRPVGFKPAISTNTDQAETIRMLENVVIPPTPALAHTHLTATLSGTRQKPNAMLLGGIIAGVAVFAVIGVVIIAVRTKPTPPPDVLPAATVVSENVGPTSPSVSPSVAPAIAPSDTPELSAPSGSSKTATKKKATSFKTAPAPAPAPKATAGTTTAQKKKDRGF
jgi:serine/threonine-protein kinase